MPITGDVLRKWYVTRTVQFADPRAEPHWTTDKIRCKDVYGNRHRVVYPTRAQFRRWAKDAKVLRFGFG
jgi:hypothetical protein